MTLSRTGAGRVGAEARGSRGVQGVQEPWGQGGEGRGQGRGAVGRGLWAGGSQPWGQQRRELGALPTGCNKQLGETGCVFQELV